MALKVVGAGFGRTGTNSLKLALEMLGFGPCHHMFEVRDNPDQVAYWQQAANGQLPDWDEVFAGYKACVDWPSAKFWREISDHYPDAKMILSVRPAEAWIKSVHATILPAMQEGRRQGRARSRMSHGLIVEQTFDGRMDDAAHAMEIYEAHNREVQASVPPERLLTFDVKEGWAPLCAHLGVPVPDTPFPRSNSTQEFLEMKAKKS